MTTGRQSGVVPLLTISVELTPGDRRTFQFRRSFRIGRMEDCDVFLDNDFVSRYHVEISCENGRWMVRDLGSSNGIYIGAKRVESTSVEHATTIRLGIYGPEVHFGSRASRTCRPSSWQRDGGGALRRPLLWQIGNR